MIVQQLVMILVLSPKLIWIEFCYFQQKSANLLPYGFRM